MIRKKISDYLLLIYLFLSMALIGWQFWTFVTIYGTTQDNLIPGRIIEYMQSLPVFLIPGLIITMISGTILLAGRSLPALINSDYFKYHYILLALYFMVILLDYLLFNTGHHYNFLELIITVIALITVYSGGMMHIKSTRVVYLHPTLMGSQYVHTALAGLAAFILVSSLTEYVSFQPGWLFALILLDMLIVLGYFRFLSTSGPETQAIARQLLGKYIFIFGARLIVGIFIPLVLVIYTCFSDVNDLNGIATLVLIGIFLQRTLFIIVTGHKDHGGI